MLALYETLDQHIVKSCLLVLYKLHEVMVNEWHRGIPVLTKNFLGDLLNVTQKTKFDK